jgi:adenylate cyclase class 2
MADGKELEVKFYISDLPALEQKLVAVGAHLKQARVLEINLRFDTPGMELTRQGRALRLRHDVIDRLTYKGPGVAQEGVHARQEIEFSVSSFHAAKDFLLALGYGVSLVYEKYRTTYELNGMEITLDEMPYGNFVEIEGPVPADIQAASLQLGLDWERRIMVSYTVLFERLKQRLNLPFRDLVFETFQDNHITSSDLDVYPADQ